MNSLPPSTVRLPPTSYDAILLVSFGGPEQPEDVMPFLENVTRGKNVPRDRLIEVAQRYAIFDGASPINGQIRALLAALIDELNSHRLQLPVYWGNRHWHPMLEDTVQDMADDGVRCALAFVTSPFGSPPSCRQYLDDIENARRQVGDDAPQIDKLRLFYNHPGFIESTADRALAALDKIPAERRSQAQLVFTAHSIPQAMAEQSSYQRQLRESCRLVMEQIQANAGTFSGEPKAIAAMPANWQLAYQSRSGPPTQPWLGPDVREHIHQLHKAGRVDDVVIVPIGFVVEHMEIAYDLDVEVGHLCDELGIHMVRAAVVGSHPRFVQMIRELIAERIDLTAPRLALGPDGPWPDGCPADCCR